MEEDQADSPGDSPADPELSRFIENMELRGESDLSVRMALWSLEMVKPDRVHYQPERRTPRAETLSGWRIADPGVELQGGRPAAQLPARVMPAGVTVPLWPCIFPHPRVRFTV